MSKTTIAITGVSGMLGSMVFDYIINHSNDDFNVIGLVRDKDIISRLIKSYPDATFRQIDFEIADENDIENALQGVHWCINAVGIIKPYIHDDAPGEVVRAIKVNSLFPDKLSIVAEKNNFKVLQIATDCVYSGLKGEYNESDYHDATDVYGKTKSLGETYRDNMHHLRCSIIGPEIRSHVSLMDWFLSQEKNASVNGYVNHRWNGVTTLHFAKICYGIIKNDLKLGHIQHIIPGNYITKADLLRCFSKEFSRTDVRVNDTEADIIIDRTLSTSNTAKNLEIWKSAGYNVPPTVEEMVNEIAKYNMTLKAQ